MYDWHGVELFNIENCVSDEIGQRVHQVEARNRTGGNIIFRGNFEGILDPYNSCDYVDRARRHGIGPYVLSTVFTIICNLKTINVHKLLRGGRTSFFPLRERLRMRGRIAEGRDMLRFFYSCFFEFYLRLCLQNILHYTTLHYTTMLEHQWTRLKWVAFEVRQKSRARVSCINIIACIV